MNITMKKDDDGSTWWAIQNYSGTTWKKPRAPRVGDVWVRPCPDGSEEEVRIAHVFNDGIQLTNGDYCGTAFEACGWRPITEPRAPRVGDVYTRGDEHMRVTAVTSDGGVFVDGTGHPDTDGSHLGAGSLAKWRLVSTGARTLAEREAAGELPDIDEDDRTPLERMTAERDAETQALFAEERHHTESLRKLKWACAFAASQGRVIAGLKAAKPATRYVYRDHEWGLP